MLTAGAYDGMLALLPRQAKIVFAGRTFLVYVRFFITLLTFLQIKIFFWFINKPGEFLVFLLSFVNVS